MHFVDHVEHPTAHRPRVHAQRAADRGGNTLEKFNWGKVFSGTYTSVFLLVIVVMGLMLLDMYLRQKKEQAS